MDANSTHAILINTHAIAAAVSFVSGTVIITRRKHLVGRRLFSVYLWSLVGMVALLGGAMLMAWPEYSRNEQIAFSGLLVLAMYMLYRAYCAQTLLESRQKGWMSERIHHIGFTLIALFEGFIVVALINLKIPGWIIGVVAIIGVLTGRRMIDMATAEQYLAEPMIPRGESP